MTFMGNNHKASFANCPGLFQFQVQFGHFISKKIPMKRFSAIFSCQSFTKRKSQDTLIFSLLAGSGNCWCSADVYWTNYDINAIAKADSDGSNPNQKWIQGFAGPLGVVVDANYIYWANFGGDTIGRVELDGGDLNHAWIESCFGPSGIALTPAPTITSFSPTSGRTGTTVTITGTNFNNADQVQFGGTNAQRYAVDSTTQITAEDAVFKHTFLRKEIIRGLFR